MASLRTWTRLRTLGGPRKASKDDHRDGSLEEVKLVGGGIGPTTVPFQGCWDGLWLRFVRSMAAAAFLKTTETHMVHKYVPVSSTGARMLWCGQRGTPTRLTTENTTLGQGCCKAKSNNSFSPSNVLASTLLAGVCFCLQYQLCFLEALHLWKRFMCFCQDLGEATVLLHSSCNTDESEPAALVFLDPPPVRIVQSDKVEAFAESGEKKAKNTPKRPRHVRTLG